LGQVQALLDVIDIARSFPQQAMDNAEPDRVGQRFQKLGRSTIPVQVFQEATPPSAFSPVMLRN
jgi:hypothetical protein